MNEVKFGFYMGEESDPPSSVGHNPPYGASINYYLGTVPADDVKIEIADAEGRTIRTLISTKQAGLNRVWWDLRHEASRTPRLRTSPVGHPEIGLRPEGWRPFPMGGTFAPLVQPGKYTAKLGAGQIEQTRELVVRKDPSSPGSEEGIRAQTRIVLDLRDQLNRVSDMIEEIESAREKIADLRVSLQNDARWKAVAAAADAVDGKLLEVESAFFDRGSLPPGCPARSRSGSRACA